MSITITPLSPERLGITGDVEMELRVPFDGDEDRFHLAISDGTLIAGEYDPDDDRFHYQVEIEGAAITRIAGDTVTVDWRPEWVTIGVRRPRGWRLPLARHRGSTRFAPRARSGLGLPVTIHMAGPRTAGADLVRVLSAPTRRGG